MALEWVVLAVSIGKLILAANFFVSNTGAVQDYATVAMLLRGRARRVPMVFGLNAVFKRQLSLAYTCHRPPDAEKETEHAPLVVLHGLFGSKQNNRSISK